MHILSRILRAGVWNILSILVLAPDVTMCQNQAKTAALCTNVQLLSSHPLAALPEKIQSTLRLAVNSKLRAIIDDSSMGLGDQIVDKVQLNALEIARSANGTSLYVVAWDDRSFGVNGFNWIVEITPKGASSLMSARASELAGGFGVEVLGSGTKRYPMVMIASKGYAQDGSGAEGEAGCFEKIGRFYESKSCPKMCQHNLNFGTNAF